MPVGNCQTQKLASPPPVSGEYDRDVMLAQLTVRLRAKAAEPGSEAEVTSACWHRR